VHSSLLPILIYSPQRLGYQHCEWDEAGHCSLKWTYSTWTD